MIRNCARLPVLFGLIAIFLNASGCSEKVVQTAGIYAVPVTVAKAQKKTVPIDLLAIGSASAYSTVSIESQVNAVLESVHIKEGQFVRKGDLLFTLDGRPFESALAQAKANLEKDKAQSELNQVQATRYGELYKAGVAAKEQYDTMQANANAQVAAVNADEAAVQSAQLQLNYCKIYAPSDGQTGALQVYPGTIVKQNDAPVMIVINQVNPIYMTFSIPEQYLGEVQKFKARGSLVVQATPYGDTKAETGNLSFIDNTVDNTTGTIKLKATFTNSDRRLWPGQFSTVSLRLAEDEDATVVPTQAVQTGQGGDFVYVVKSDATVDQRQVKVTRTVGGDSVISSGISPGDTVVTDGQMRLLPGIKVQVRNPAAGS
jgi:membrane fusion protein, multidrug efflux system